MNAPTSGDESVSNQREHVSKCCKIQSRGVDPQNEAEQNSLHQSPSRYDLMRSDHNNQNNKANSDASHMCPYCWSLSSILASKIRYSSNRNNSNSLFWEGSRAEDTRQLVAVLPAVTTGAIAALKPTRSGAETKVFQRRRPNT